MKKNGLFFKSYKGISIGDRVIKKSGKPFLVKKLFLKKCTEKYVFSGKIDAIKYLSNDIVFVTIKNRKYSIKDILISDIELLDKEKFLSNVKVWRSISLVESKCLDFRFSCFTDYFKKPKQKEKYNNLLKAYLAAYTLQAKNENKKYVIYKCQHCNDFHVGGDLKDEHLEMIEHNFLPLMGLS